MDAKEAYHGLLLINALNLHKNTVHSLWQLSKQQNNFLKKKDYNKLFDSRQEKENLLQSLKKWGIEIRYYYDNWSEWQEKLNGEEKRSVGLIMNKITKTIENLLMLEIENRTLLEQRKQELIGELGTFHFYQECLSSVYDNRN